MTVIRCDRCGEYVEDKYEMHHVKVTHIKASFVNVNKDEEWTDSDPDLCPKCFAIYMDFIRKEGPYAEKKK